MDVRLRIHIPCSFDLLVRGNAIFVGSKLLAPYPHIRQLSSPHIAEAGIVAVTQRH